MVRVFRNITLLEYECIRSCPGFAPNFFSVMSQEDIDNKIELLSLYQTQTDLYYNTEFAIRSLASTRGISIGSEFAEGYVVGKIVLNPPVL